MKSIKLVCFSLIALCLIGSLAMSSATDPTMLKNLADQGQVKGEQFEENSQSEDPVKFKKVEPDLMSNDKPSKKADKPHQKNKQTEQIAKKSVEPAFTNNSIINLLLEPVVLIDRSLTLSIPNQSHLAESSWLLQITADLSTEEELIGFDRPGFTISFDQKIIFQLTAQEISQQEDSRYTFSFNFSQSDQLPNKISIWAGNEGDQLLPTTAQLHEITLEATRSIKTSPLTKGNLKVYQDHDQYFTLSWTGSHSCLIQVRSSLEPINQENWQQAEVVSPAPEAEMCPQIITGSNLYLLKKPHDESVYFALGIVNLQGNLEALFMEDFTEDFVD